MARRSQEEEKSMKRNGSMKTYRDLVKNVRRVEDITLSTEDRRILADVVQEAVLPDGVSLDDPIDLSVLEWIVQLRDTDDPELDLVPNISGSTVVDDVLQFFAERRHLEPYLNGALDEDPMTFDSVLNIALVNVLYDWVVAFIEEAKRERLRLATCERKSLTD